MGDYLSAEVSEDISRRGVDLGQSDLKTLWSEAARLSKLPKPGFVETIRDTKVSVSFVGSSGSSREANADDLEDLLSLSQVPDEVSDFTIRHQIQFESEENRGSWAPDNYQYRKLSISVDVRGEARIRASGDRDWVDLVSAQLPPIFYRRKREVVLKRLALSIGFAVPVALALFYSASRLVQVDNENITLALALAGVLTLMPGAMAIYSNSEKLLPASRVAIRGEPRDPRILQVLWEIALGVIVAVVAGVILISIGFS